MGAEKWRGGGGEVWFRRLKGGVGIMTSVEFSLMFHTRKEVSGL